MYKQEATLISNPQTQAQDNTLSRTRAIALSASIAALAATGLGVELNKIGDGDYDPWEVGVKFVGSAFLFASGMLADKLWNEGYIHSAAAKIGLFSPASRLPSKPEPEELNEPRQTVGMPV